METARLNLIKNLFDILNNDRNSSTNYIIAMYFVDNYKRIPSLNIYDVAEDTHISRSTIRRFFSQLGYSNFKEFKLDFSGFDDGIDRYYSFYNKEFSGLNFYTSLNNLFTNMNERIKVPELNEIIKYIKNSNNIYIIGSSQINNTINRAQQKYILFNIKLLIPKEIPQLCKQMCEKDILFIISISGKFYTHIKDELPKNRLIVLFTNNSEIISYGNTIVYHLTSISDSTINLMLYSYGVEYFFDLLLSEYINEEFKTLSIDDSISS